MVNLAAKPVMFAADTDKVETSEPRHPLGTKGSDDKGNEYIYLLGVANTAVASWVVYDEEFATSLLAANAKGNVAIAMAATVADTYGWYQIVGKATGKVLASFADNGLIFATATAGSVDDAAVAGDLVVGAIGRSAVASGVATIQLSYPFATDNLGS